MSTPSRRPQPQPPQPPQSESPHSDSQPRDPAALIFDDPLNQQSPDDTDHGWGDRPGGGESGGDGGAADLARFLDEKPPHHL